MKKLIALLLTLAMVLCLAACTPADSGTQPDNDGNDNQNQTADPNGEGEQEEGVKLTVKVVDLEGNEETFEYVTTAATVGEALLAEGLIEGEEGPYGLYIKTVNGITADYDVDQTYWAFYINGEYATTGADQTEIDETAVYSFVQTQG